MKNADKKNHQLQRINERVNLRRAEGSVVECCLANGEAFRFLITEEKAEVVRLKKERAQKKQHK